MSLATWSAGAIWATAFTSRGGSICMISITPLPPPGASFFTMAVSSAIARRRCRGSGSAVASVTALVVTLLLNRSSFLCLP